MIEMQNKKRPKGRFLYYRVLGNDGELLQKKQVVFGISMFGFVAVTPFKVPAPQFCRLVGKAAKGLYFRGAFGVHCIQYG